MLAPPLLAEEPTPAFVLIHRTEWFADGTHKTTHLAVNAVPDAADHRVAADFRAALAIPSAQVDFSVRWPLGSKIDFYMNSKAKPNRKRINSVVKKHVNKRRGTSSVPTQKATSKSITILPIGSFSNRTDYYFQTFLNGQSFILKLSPCLLPAICPGSCSNSSCQRSKGECRSCDAENVSGLSDRAHERRMSPGLRPAL